MKISKENLRRLIYLGEKDVLDVGSVWDDNLGDFSDPIIVKVIANEECGTTRFNDVYQLIIQYPDLQFYRAEYELGKTEYNFTDPFAGSGYEELQPVDATIEIVQIEKITWRRKF